jgi:hypothetical protein
MSASYTLSTDVGRVRLLVPDRDLSSPVFQDEEVTALLAIEGGVQRAAALALETIASDTAATLRYTQTLGLTVDGTKASAELLKRAAQLRAQAAAADEVAAGADGLIDWAEMAVDPFSAREILRAARLRSAV